MAHSEHRFTTYLAESTYANDRERVRTDIKEGDLLFTAAALTLSSLLNIYCRTDPIKQPLDYHEAKEYLLDLTPCGADQAVKVANSYEALSHCAYEWLRRNPGAQIVTNTGNRYFLHRRHRGQIALVVTQDPLGTHELTRVRQAGRKDVVPELLPQVPITIKRSIDAAASNDLDRAVQQMMYVERVGRIAQQFAKDALDSDTHQ